MTPATLTPREREVAALVRDGWLAREIADALGMQVCTARRHIENIAKKLPPSRGGARTRILRGVGTSANGASPPTTETSGMMPDVGP